MIAKSEHWDVSPGILLAVDAPGQRTKHDVIPSSNRISSILTWIGVRFEDLWLSSAMLVSFTASMFSALPIRSNQYCCASFYLSCAAHDPLTNKQLDLENASVPKFLLLIGRSLLSYVMPPIQFFFYLLYLNSQYY